MAVGNSALPYFSTPNSEWKWFCLTCELLPVASLKMWQPCFAAFGGLIPISERFEIRHRRGTAARPHPRLFWQGHETYSIKMQADCIIVRIVALV